MRNRLLVLAGMGLLVVAVFGVVHSTWAGLAQLAYFRVKHGSSARSLNDVDAISERVYGLYPRHYALCLWTGRRFHGEGLRASGEERKRLFRKAWVWCERGRAENPVNAPLRLLKTRLLQQESLPSAIRLWEEVVAWDFWQPFNHAVLIDLYCGDGAPDRAIEELQWIRGSSYEEAARQDIRNAWARERVRPTAVPAPAQGEGAGPGMERKNTQGMDGGEAGRG